MRSRIVAQALASAAFGALAMAAIGITPANAEGTTLTYLASQGWVADAELELGKKFEEQTGIHIDYQIIPSDQYFSVLRTKLNSGEAPDIFGGQSGVTDLQLQYNVEKNALDLSNEPWAKLEDPLVAAQASVDGKLYGLTYWDTLGGPPVVNYNKEIFARFNLEAPTSFEGLKTICTTLLDNGIQPIYEPVSDGWHHVLWFFELGPHYEKVTPGLAEALNANQATFSENEAMLTVLTQLKDLYDSGCFGTNALSDAYSESGKVMAEGDAAMVLAANGFIQQMKNDFPDIDANNYGIFLIPLGDNQQLNINPAGPTKFVSATSPHADAAKQYLQFLTQPENMQYFIDHSPQFNNLPFPGLTSKLSPETQAFMDRYKDARGTVYQTAVTYANAQWMDVGKDLTAMFTGAMQPADVLSSIDSRRTDLARTARDPAWQ